MKATYVQQFSYSNNSKNKADIKHAEEQKVDYLVIDVLQCQVKTNILPTGNNQLLAPNANSH